MSERAKEKARKAERENKPRIKKERKGEDKIRTGREREWTNRVRGTGRGRKRVRPLQEVTEFLDLRSFCPTAHSIATI